MSSIPGVSETMTASRGCSDVAPSRLVKLSQVMLVGNRYRKQFHLPLLPFYQDPDMKITKVKQGKKTITRIEPRHTRARES